MDIQKIIDDTDKYANEITIKKLVEILKECSEAYYNTGETKVDDETYDRMMEILKKRSPKNPWLKKIGAPVAGKIKVKLPYWMGSMNKIKQGEENRIERWRKKYTEEVVISDKLDGASCMIYYDSSKKEMKMYTRGDEGIGGDISKIYEYIGSYESIKNIEKYKGKQSIIAIRGELVMSKENFKKYRETFKNARNTISGLINSKTFDEKLIEMLKDVDFVAHEVINPWLQSHLQMKLIQKLGLKCVNYIVKQSIDDNYLTDFLNDRIQNGEYEIDGIIITDNGNHVRNTEDNPDYSFAYKIDGKPIAVDVVDVIWQPSKDKLLIPRIQIIPTFIEGTTITYTTGFNAKFVVDNEIGPGSKLGLIRCGGVIPHIKTIIQHSPTGASLPSIKYKWASTNHSNEKIHFIIDCDEENRDVSIKLIAKFLAALGVESVGAGIVTKIYDNGYTDIISVIKLTVDDLLEIDGIQSKLANKIYSNINSKLKNVDLVDLMVASNQFGHGFGTRKLKKIIENFPDILDTPCDTNSLLSLKKSLLDIDGFSEITSSSFISSLPLFIDFYHSLSPYITLAPLSTSSSSSISPSLTPTLVTYSSLSTPLTSASLLSHSKAKTAQSTGKKHNFKDQIVVFTGFRNSEWQKIIENNGGKVTTSISKKTTLVVFKDNDTSSSKYLKAQELNIKLISLSQFESLVN